MLGGTRGLRPWPCMKGCGPTETSNTMLFEYDSACKVCMMMAILLVLSWSLYTFLSIIQFFFQVQRHLSKLFDNLAKMKFQLDSEQKPTKIGLGMYSREEEYVSFSEHCDCSGQVRTVWWGLLSHPLFGLLSPRWGRASVLFLCDTKAGRGGCVT